MKRQVRDVGACPATTTYERTAAGRGRELEIGPVRRVSEDAAVS